MSISEAQAGVILQAFDKIQMEDLLSREQWLLALMLMDFYPSLGGEYVYLRNRYDESQPSGVAESPSVGEETHPES